MEHDEQRGVFDQANVPQPQYQYVMRHAGPLACGDFAVEPVLGPARVMPGAARKRGALRAGQWADDDGPCTAAGRYKMEQRFAVRMPAEADRQRIGQTIEQAAWLGRPIRANTARLIGPYLHGGPTTAMHRFTTDGSIYEWLFDELDQVHRDRPALRPWAHALAG